MWYHEICESIKKFTWIKRNLNQNFDLDKKKKKKKVETESYLSLNSSPPLDNNIP